MTPKPELLRVGSKPWQMAPQGAWCVNIYEGNDELPVLFGTGDTLEAARERAERVVKDRERVEELQRIVAHLHVLYFDNKLCDFRCPRCAEAARIREGK